MLLSYNSWMHVSMQMLLERCTVIIQVEYSHQIKIIWPKHFSLGHSAYSDIYSRSTID